MVRESTVYLFAAALLFSACKKDEPVKPEPAATEISAQEKISGNASKSWVLTSWTTKEQFGVITNSYLTLDSCEMDDEYTFYANKTFLRTDGKLACNPGSNTIHLSAATWELQKNNTELKFNTFGGGSVFKIKSLSNTTLVLNLPLLILDNDTISTTYTFTAK
ncbi:lipocalin family protein [Adhaeribacter sp. BT258]|uniref:Lipocalin family protein n=1 Tax=Adhaeribacter terrigena TaxID=2793070 RepID=A0ABS1C399_9BACT|nr:lipocalin family protein [Adhaeribacter terrigena]MBK0403872.1 lipocalin family protein [Adhaeribacter terrigena]